MHGGLGRDGAVLGDAYVLDTKLWEWHAAPTAVRRSVGKRAGHTLSCLPRAAGGPTIVAFGGRGADFEDVADLVAVDADAFGDRGATPAPTTLPMSMSL